MALSSVYRSVPSYVNNSTRANVNQSHIYKAIQLPLKENKWPTSLTDAGMAC